VEVEREDGAQRQTQEPVVEEEDGRRDLLLARARDDAREDELDAVARREGTDEPNAGDAGGYLTSRVHRVGGARARATREVSLEDTRLSGVFIATKDAVE